MKKITVRADAPERFEFAHGFERFELARGEDYVFGDAMAEAIAGTGLVDVEDVEDSAVHGIELVEIDEGPEDFSDTFDEEE